MDGIQFRDDPWRRLPWLVGLALQLTFGALLGFMQVLEQAPDVRSVPAPVDVQVVELPPVAPAPAPQRAPRVKEVPPRLPPRPPEPEPRVVAPPPPVAAPPPAPGPEPERTPPPRVTLPEEPTAPGSPGPVPGGPLVTGSAPHPGPTTPPGSGPIGPAQPPGPLGPGTSSRAPAAPGVPGGVPGGGGSIGARAIYQPLPEIPEALRHREIALVAVARFHVGADGSAQVELITPTSDPELNRVLLETLKRWRFFPAMQQGKPVASTVEIRIPISVR